MLSYVDLVSLRSKQGKLVRVTLAKSLYLVGDNEQFRLSEQSELNRISTIKGVVGYLTRYSLSDSDSFKWLKINPFGGNGLVINENGGRAGDITIRLNDIKKIERLEEIFVSELRE